MMKKRYYTIRILAAFLVMGSFGIGFMAAAEYGKLTGLLTFIVMVALGIFLHITADKIQKVNKSIKA
jgi:hypothetical protein